MDTKQTVLDYLAQHEGQWVSSKEIVTTLAVSRTAVWKAIKQLQEHHYQIDSQTGKGYLYTPNATLSQTVIAQQIAPEWTLEVHDQIDSTNIRAKQLAAQPQMTPTVVVANEQTTGYGRFGRHFYSPSQTGIYMSFLLPIEERQLNPGKLTTGVAVAAANAIEQQYDVDVQIKWVNDLVVNEHKVAGILSEAIADVESGTISSVIVGIGINIAPSDVVPAELRRKVGALTSLTQLDRNKTVVNVIQAVTALLKNEDHHAIMDEYRRRCFVIGQRVQVRIGKRELDGVVQTIDDDGALQLQTKTGRQMVGAGEITKLNLKDGGYRG